jgi:transcriptional regulator with XRE-family HTH domain
MRMRKKRTRKARPKVGAAIRAARRATGLTASALGPRIGVLARAIYRWEQDHVAPSKRHRAKLVAEIRVFNPAAADTLLRALNGEPPIAQGQPSDETLTITKKQALEFATFLAADELELVPRRLRGPLTRLFKRLDKSGFTFESARTALESWIAQG